jgi:RimJ/RimL family protein N-acetyltransferase
LTVPPPPVPIAPPGSLWTFRALEPDTVAGPSPDVDLVHRWMHAPHVEAWWHEAWPRELWAETVHAFRDAQHALHSVPVFACAAGAPGPGPVAYLQVYRVARDRLRSSYGFDDHDLGVHIAIGRDTDIDRRHGRAILRAACEGLLAADPRCRRVVAEPDETNQLSVRAFLAAGFEYVRRIELPEKTASLLVFPRTPADAVLPSAVAS